MKESHLFFPGIPRLRQEGYMTLLYRRCAGLDIHKKSVSCCIRIRQKDSKDVEIKKAVFGTFSADLRRLRDWPKENKVRQIAMESTGVYWITVWNVLEPVRLRFELVLVNPQIVRALRGSKTDRIDARRIAEYLQYGLLRGSFVPPREIRHLRDLTRMRVHLQQDRNRVINRIARWMETANVKLSLVVSNVVGKTGRAILAAIVAGRTDPEFLAYLAQGSSKQEKAELAAALQGRFSEHFRGLLGCWLQELEWLDARVAEVDWRLSDALQPYADRMQRLVTIPGVGLTTAEVLIAELGADVSPRARSELF